MKFRLFTTIFGGEFVYILYVNNDVKNGQKITALSLVLFSVNPLWVGRT
ncbi:hypothetical protein [Avibacterium endocarditidis]|nr:hypothetical protein [Avibacterium endocarditidis]